MDANMQDSPLVSGFDLHHSVSIRYPALELLHEEDRWRMARPKDIGTRYEPSALVDDPRVIEGTNRDVEEETRFVSYTRALSGHSEQYEPNDIDDSMEAHNVETLLKDMEKLSRCAGSTTLKVVMYKPSACTPEQRITYILISRTSKLQCADTSIKVLVDFYTFPTSMFRRLAETDTNNEAWYRDIRDLLLLESDRAIRHARLAFQQYRDVSDNAVANFAVGFCPPRLPSLVPLICREVTKEDLAKEITKDEDASECHICKLEFDHDETVPVRINNGCKHIYCQACLTTWVMGNGDKAKCPMCRNSLTTPDGFLDFKLGVDSTGNYINDDRFNAWENFERSCADLDSTQASSLRPLAENCITVNAKLLVSVWDMFVEQARTEPTSSTPAHHNPANFPELEIVRTCLGSSLDRIDGAVRVANGLYYLLSKAIDDALFKAFVSSEAATLVEERQIAWASYDIGRAETMGLRPNLEPFVKRTLNRVINFARLRCCECDGEVGLHTHGMGRMYYTA